jgi:hypothetical protein
MSKIIYDLIQRFEVENGVPRLISTKIEVIEGGEDLMSLATRLLKQLGFYEKFEEKRTSQYIGYRRKNPGKGDKRYQLILGQRKEGLCISIPQDFLEPYLLKLKYWVTIEEAGVVGDSTKGFFWVLPSKKNLFLNSLHHNYWVLLDEGKIVGDYYLNDFTKIDNQLIYLEDALPSITLNEFNPHNLSDPDSYLILNADNLFPYTLQVCISSSAVLEEFVGYFGKVIFSYEPAAFSTKLERDSS